MPDFYGFCIALLAAVGVVCLVWLLAGLILRPRGDFTVTAVVHVRTADELTGVTQRYDWMRHWGGGAFPLIIITDDLEDEALRLAGLYTRETFGVRLCRLEELDALFQ